jgi:DNA-binding transcriptional LysR family regulator
MRKGRDTDKLISLSTDQAVTFVELAARGTLREAADAVNISEQAVRNRLLVLENALGVELYRKSRGIRTANPLTAEGHKLVPHALAFLEAARELRSAAPGLNPPVEIRIAATQYMILYVLIDAVKRFHKSFPGIRIQLTNRTEQEIERALLDDPKLAFGVAAPYDASSKLDYTHLFSMQWSLITPRRHPLLKKKRFKLKHLNQIPLILFERGSTGRQHIMDAFHGAELTPRVEMETTNTEIILKMVESGLGVSIVPLMTNGSVTRRHRIEVIDLGDQVAPIHSGILSRKGGKHSTAAQAFINALTAEVHRRD